MLGDFLQDLIGQPSEWINDIRSPEGLRQVATLLAAAVLVWPLSHLLGRALSRVETKLDHIPWTRQFFDVAQGALLPATLWLLVQLAVGVFRDSGWEPAFLTWAAPLVGLWFSYRLFAAMLEGSLRPEQARLWSRQVLLPVILIVAVLHGIGMLNNVLLWGYSFREDLRITVGSVIAGFAVLGVFFVVARGVRQFLAQVFLPEAGAEPALTQALSALIAYAVVLVGTLVALAVVGIDLTTLAVVAGGLSVGLGFGLQEIVSNFVSGFILLFERSIGPDDVIEVGDTTGIVQTVGVRSTVIKSRDNIELIVPNSRFLTDVVTNFTRADPIVRLKIGVGVTYDVKPREVEEALLEAANHPRVLRKPAPQVRFREFGDSSLNFDLLVWTDDPARIRAMSSDLRYGIWDALAAREIEIPFPQRDIHIRSGVPWDYLAETQEPSQD